MKVVVLGAGKLGRRVTAYIKDKHDVVVVEQDDGRAQAIAEELGVRVVRGDGDEPYVLLEAGTDGADVFLAATGHDEDNLVAALLAKNEFKVKKVIAACRNPRNRWLFNRSWGVDVAVDSAQIVGRLIEEEATLSEVVTLLNLREGEFSVTSVAVLPKSGLIGVSLAELNVPSGCTAAALLRASQVLPAGTDTVLQEGDELIMILREGAVCDVASLVK